MIDLPQLKRQSSIPLKEQLKSWIMEQIQNGTWQKGDCIPSINKLAKGFAIARETVRQTFETLVEKEILIPEHGKGYFINGREKRALRVGLLGKIDGVYIRPICDGLMEELGEDVPLLMLDSQRSTNTSADLIQNLAYHQSVDRLLVIPVRGQEESLSQAIEPYRRYFKIAWLDRAPKEIKDASFLCDYEEAVRMGLKEFKKIGIKKRIYFSRNSEDDSVFTLMRKAFSEFESEGGNPNLILNSIDKVNKIINSSKGQTIGVFVETSQEAVFLQSQLLKLGINIPQEVSIICCDDTEWCQLVTPQISCINPGFNELGKMAGCWIKQEESAAIQQTISPKYIQRQSSL
ncbi:MAG: hypothetical protein COA79_08695 [Planctomycetota bacterium]|nr:MAG: hypothetical protein COA79_08695 [Planctomycetota bacterium]